MSPRKRLFHHETFRSRAIVATTLFATTAVAATACIPPTAPTPTTTTVPAAVCEVPEAPVLSIIAASETLRFTVPGAGAIEIAAVAGGTEPADVEWAETDELPLATFDGPTRVLARSASTDCEVVDQFDATYDVRDTYPGRPGVVGTDSPSVPAASEALIGWATGYSDYTVGADVTANFQTPQHAVGPYSTSVVVLGNGGSITMTFDTPITDGPGDDLAVFENGFYENATSQRLFTELAYVEVSSNGTDFVRFDSASLRSTPVGAFEFQDVRELGGLAGKDGGGFGTPFDLTALANSAEVRNGVIDLSAITHVRIVDVVGASDYPNPGDTYLDSFGRQLFDTHLAAGSGGFDLRAVGVLNEVAS